MRLIDVDELLKKLNQLYEEQGLTPEPTGDDWDDGAGSIFDDIVEIINEQPTIEPVKRSKWINTYGDTPYDARDKNNWWHCSECKYPATTLFKSPHCPCCGAKMECDNE